MIFIAWFKSNDLNQLTLAQTRDNTKANKTRALTTGDGEPAVVLSVTLSKHLLPKQRINPNVLTRAIAYKERGAHFAATAIMTLCYCDYDAHLLEWGVHDVGVPGQFRTSFSGRLYNDRNVRKIPGRLKIKLKWKQKACFTACAANAAMRQQAIHQGHTFSYNLDLQFLTFFSPHLPFVLCFKPPLTLNK